MCLGAAMGVSVDVWTCGRVDVCEGRVWARGRGWVWAWLCGTGKATHRVVAALLEGIKGGLAEDRMRQPVVQALDWVCQVQQAQGGGSTAVTR